MNWIKGNEPPPNGIQRVIHEPENVIYDSNGRDKIYLIDSLAIERALAILETVPAPRDLQKLAHINERIANINRTYSGAIITLQREI